MAVSFSSGRRGYLGRVRIFGRQFYESRPFRESRPGEDMGVRENQFEGSSNKNEPMHGGSQNPRNQPTNIGNNLGGGENQFVMSSFKNVPLHGGAQHPPSNPQPPPKISKCQNETNEHSVALQNSTHPKPNPSKQSPQHHNGAHMKLKEHTQPQN